MGVEDQQEEREVLESIFPEEIADVSETEFRISIALEITRGDGDPKDLQAPTIILNVQYPPSYPDEAPRLDITQPPNAPKHPYLDIQDDKQRLLDSLSETIEENLGMAMIFTLVNVLKDSAELLISERQNAKQALADMEAAKAEEEENKKFQGEAVTRESFIRWREGFAKEMEEKRKREEEEREAEDKKKKVPKEERKLTGKELWQQGLAKGGDEDDDGIDVQAMKDLKVAAES
ncbi:putative RWD domain protein [Didymella exigua CBS 183.55]|uniref:Putative RWD domain protein n=1 Tax=Didymella exigua CBS 183.55 TaxID=1150837 RepID=A0A6A5RTX7_9PLEO|nr:putative RWD domain protein [Didymella exigua CBS 183.55]KAF1930820.1 putative RWD domain protein [Didymella exigua CBS 183.55]